MFVIFTRFNISAAINIYRVYHIDLEVLDTRFIISYQYISHVQQAFFVLLISTQLYMAVYIQDTHYEFPTSSDFKSISYQGIPYCPFIRDSFNDL